MEKGKRLELWQLKLDVTSGSGLRKIQRMDLCATECTSIFLPLFCSHWAKDYFYTSTKIMQHPFDMHPLNPKFQ
jgi:hypothetical protein